MAAMKFNAKVAEDGMLHVPVPGLLPGSNVEVEVHESIKRDIARDSLGWPVGFHEQYFGCITDETFIRHPQPELPKPINFDERESP